MCPASGTKVLMRHRYPTQAGEELQLPSEPPITPVSCEDLTHDAGTSSAACSNLNSVCKVVTWAMVQEATTSDASMQQLVAAIQEGFPHNVWDTPAVLRPYHRYSESLCSLDGVVLMGDWIVILPTLRRDILDALHSAHQGINAMCARAADSVFWPSITTDITRIRDQCGNCNRVAKSNPMQPPTDITPPDYPFQKIACDYFHDANMDYVVIVDRYSN